MSDAFDRLSPALQYQIVNALGWTSLRPVQNVTIDAVLDDCNAVVLAPTAGGKTEAAFFPLLSRMDSEDWQAPSVLYLAPIKALLNNQAPRLERLTGLIGRRSFVWHGDVGQSRRRKMASEPADVLAITPEALEALLIGTSAPRQRLLGQVRAVVIDEVHAFPDSDRGAHLAAVLERVQRIAGRDIQRIGLSATVGNPDDIADWLSGSSERPRRVVDPTARTVSVTPSPQTGPELALDYVGSLANAALMIERLHPGQKRLVFCDSRRQVEALGHELGARGVEVYVTHSSLSASQRTLAERAFEEGRDCVIVATSALELGIDVGDLDRVLQIGAPSTVASFLQRMGRTGRRPGTRPNCTFLAIDDSGLLQAAALLRLHAAGYVEPVRASARASHVLAHQLMALTLQQRGGVARGQWWPWVVGAAGFRELRDGDRESLVAHMLSASILADVDGRLVLGDRGEKLYGKRHFAELYAVFSTPRVLKVMWGPREVGSLDASFLMHADDTSGDDGGSSFVLAGRAWRIQSVDWRRGTCTVQPDESGRYPRWMGSPRLLSGALCGAIESVLASREHDACWSQRACRALDGLRLEHAIDEDGAGHLVDEPDRITWWTFAGGAANNVLARGLEVRLGGRVSSDNLRVVMREDAANSVAAVRDAMALLHDTLDVGYLHTLVPGLARQRLSKFQPCLPEALELELLADGLLDLEGACAALERVRGADPHPRP